MYETDKAQELRRRADLDGYGVLTKGELSYLVSKSLNVHEQETIKSIYGLKLQAELVAETKKVAIRTWWVAFGTWTLPLATMLLVYMTKK